MQYLEFLEKVKEKGVLESHEKAVRITEVVLENLGKRITKGERKNLAAQLPPELKKYFEYDGEVEKIDFDTFIDRIRIHVGAGCRESVTLSYAVINALKHATTAGAIKHVISQLPSDFRQLFGNNLEEAMNEKHLMNVQDELDTTTKIYGHIVKSGLLPAEITPMDAVAAVFCTLMQRISGGEAKDLFSTMPLELQILLRTCALHKDEQPEIFGESEFLKKLSAHLKINEQTAKSVATAVFRGVQAEIPSKEIDDVESQLPSDLKQLWRKSAA